LRRHHAENHAMHRSRLKEIDNAVVD